MRCDSMSPLPGDLGVRKGSRATASLLDCHNFLPTPCVRCKPLVDTLVDTCSQADCDCGYQSRRNSSSLSHAAAA